MTGELSARGEFIARQTFVPGELARVCRVNTNTLTSWCRDGLMPFLKTPGGQHRYRRRELTFLPGPGHDPQLLTYAEFAAALRVHPHSLTRWRRRGRIQPVCLPGGYPRLLRADADQLLAAAGLTRAEVDMMLSGLR